MNDLIQNAQEAKLKAMAQLNEDTLKELNEVLGVITEVVNEGEFETYIYKFLKETTLIALSSKGFNVEHLDSFAAQKDGVYYKISW